MSRSDERRWSILGTLVICLFLLVAAFEIGLHIGRAPDKYERKAIDSIEAALAIVYGPMDDPTVPMEEYYDDLTDNLHDAIAWLEYEP